MPGQPRHQDQGRDDRRQHRRFLVGQHGRTQYRTEDDGLPPAGLAAQPDCGLQGHRQEQRPEGQVHLVPATPGEDRGQAEEPAGRDRAELGGQPEPGGPVHHVAQQAGAQDGEQVVGEARPEGQRDGGHHQAGQRHQGVVAQIRPDRRGQVPGGPGAGQMGHLAGHPPEVPDVAAGVPGGRQPARQVGDPGPGDRQPGDQITRQQHQVRGQRVLPQPGEPRGGRAGITIPVRCGLGWRRFDGGRFDGRRFGWCRFDRRLPRQRRPSAGSAVGKR